MTELDTEPALSELFELPRWVPYRMVWSDKREKFDKVPHTGKHGLSTKDPSHWMTYAEAVEASKEPGLSGVGLVMTGGIQIDDWQLVGLDFDDVDFENFKPPFDSYTELSPSHTGEHSFLWVPAHWAAKFKDSNIPFAACHHAEIYFGTAPRFLTVTFEAIEERAIAQVKTTEALGKMEKWGLNKAVEPKQLQLPEAIGTAVDMSDFGLSVEQNQLCKGTGQMDRSAVLHGLLIKLIDGGAPLDDVLATIVDTPALWKYCMEHRRDIPERALQFAREEISRAYAKSFTGMRAELVGFNDKWQVVAPAATPASVVPLEARHLCTDQGNAKRLQQAAGGRVMFAAGRWYVWAGTHWSADRAAAYRHTCDLSRLIEREAEDWKSRPTNSAEEKKRNGEISEALLKWGKASEMKPRLDAAFALLQQTVEVSAERLNRDPYLLNVLNGTVDLRTGTLQPHTMGDLITHLIPIDYDPNAEAPTFKRVLLEICGGSKPLAAFLQRWFGYCATGVTNEQVFAVLHGDGANGKSLLLDAITRVLGPYAGTAAPDLLIQNGKQSRHPAEIADLFGMRLVVSHESGESGSLREDFIKQATGGDKLKARLMRQDFFEFTPTHTLNLLTNHKPQIRGQDKGIWRRVMLVPFGVTFGTAAEVEQGTAHHLRDDHLAEALKAEDAGILAWLVQGATMWCMAGLRPPDAVLAAGAEYKSEQDRVGEYLIEHYQCSNAEWVPCDAVYKGYKTWAFESGYHPLGKNNFIEAVAKRPGITKALKWIDHGGLGARQKMCFSGLK